MNITIHQSHAMICGSAEAEAERYRKVEGKSGATWLVPISTHAAENVHVDQHDPRSEGYGGRTLEFTLEDGTVYAAKGPWHSNADALFADTGVDVRSLHRTYVVLSKNYEWSYDKVEMIDVVYADAAPMLGRYDRYKELCRQYPEARFYYMESRGGSSCGPITEQDRATS